MKPKIIAIIVLVIIAAAVSYIYYNYRVRFNGNLYAGQYGASTGLSVGLQKKSAYDTQTPLNNPKNFTQYTKTNFLIPDLSNLPNRVSGVNFKLGNYLSSNDAIRLDYMGVYQTTNGFELSVREAKTGFSENGALKEFEDLDQVSYPNTQNGIKLGVSKTLTGKHYIRFEKNGLDILVGANGAVPIPYDTLIAIGSSMK